MAKSKHDAAKASGALSKLKHKTISVISPKKSKKQRKNTIPDRSDSDASPRQSGPSCSASKYKPTIEDAEDDADNVSISSGLESAQQEAPDSADAQAEEAEAQLSM
jgi:hypothetical protein